MQHPEDELQKKILTKLFREYPQGVTFHVPNGGLRGKREGQRLKLLGVLAGVNDLVVVRPNARVGWIEVKDKGKKTSDVQDKFHARILALGHISYVVDEIEQLTPIIKRWLAEDDITFKALPTRRD